MKSRINKLKYEFELTDGGDVYYYKNNKNHREKDLPAVILKDGSRGWLKNGLSHRDNGKPSDISSDGRMYWYEYGKFIKMKY